MTAAIRATATDRARPATLTAAIILTVLNAVVPFPLLPTVDGLNGFIIGMTTVIGVLLLVGAWGLWQSSRWAAIGVFAVSAINGLLAFGSIFTSNEGTPDTFDRVFGAVACLSSLVVCALLLQRASRRALR